MSEFRTPLDVRLVCPWANDGTGQWQGRNVFRYYSSELGQEVEIDLGFSSDLASVPKAPVLFLLFGGRYAIPSYIHDYLTRYRRFRREKCDRVFLEAMRLQNKMEIQAMKDAGIDDDEIADRKAALEGRATAMYAGVAAYTKSGRWKSDVDQPGFEVML